jgi:hypothetical protein
MIMEKKKIHIVVSEGRVESVLSADDVEVEIIDLDGSDEERQGLDDYVGKLRAELKETIC